MRLIIETDPTVQRVRAFNFSVPCGPVTDKPIHFDRTQAAQNDRNFRALSGGIHRLLTELWEDEGITYLTFATRKTTEYGPYSYFEISVKRGYDWDELVKNLILKYSACVSYKPLRDEDVRLGTVEDRLPATDPYARMLHVIYWNWLFDRPATQTVGSITHVVAELQERQ